MSSTDAVTMAFLSKALDAAALRHQAIAANLANANSVGYQPLRVNFEQQLGIARAALARGGSPLTATDVAALQPRFEQEPATPDGAPAVRIDMEMVRLSQNTLQYQALLKGINNRMALLATAVTEGRK